jgi:multicomponent Na+:H+ antiporter subunit D
MLVAMGMAAVLCIAIGVFPQPLYALLPHPVDFEPYTGVHVTESLGILMFTALGFVVFLRMLDPENTISIDTDWFYRKGARAFMWLAENPLARYEKAVSDVSETTALPLLHGAARAGLQVDLNGVDAIVNGVARAILHGGAALRRLQTGVVTHYALAMITGLIAATAIFAVAWR